MRSSQFTALGSSELCELIRVKKTEQALEESERRFRETFYNAPQPIALTLSDGRYLEANQAYCDLFGYSWEELREKTFVELTYPEDRESTAYNPSVQLLSGEIPSFRSEKRYLHRSGKVIWCEIVVSKVVRPDGSFDYFVAHLKDISKEKELELARESEAKRKEEFIATLSHELRNPLAAIRHAVELVKETPQESPLQPRLPLALFKVIDRQSRRLKSLVDDLLDIERLNHGKVYLKKKRVRIHPILMGAVSAVKGLCLSKKQTISIAADPELAVSGESLRLEQIFTNLLHNAAKFTQEHGAIRVRAFAQEKDAVVSVSDDGPGIPPDLITSLFDGFTQGKIAAERALGGLGLGLKIVRSLVEKHGGQIAVESPGEGQGANFTVRFPLLVETGSSDSAGEAKAFHHNLIPNGDPIRLLLVDDHVDSVKGLSLILSKRNCVVQVAHDGVTAIERAHAFEPEVILMDIGLPDMGGCEVAQSLRQEMKFQRTRFIAMSGYTNERDRARSLAAGFDEHFAKPVNVSAVMQIVASCRE